MGKSESRLKLSSLIASNFCLLGLYIYLLCQEKEEFIETSGMLGISFFSCQNQSIEKFIFKEKQTGTVSVSNVVELPEAGLKLKNNVAYADSPYHCCIHVLLCSNLAFPIQTSCVVKLRL